MSARKRKYSDDEIEAQTLERLNDPDAWEAPVYVPPLAVERPSWVTLGRHLELAAKFHVVSVLHRLGADANLTLAQPDGVDITVVLSSGQAITIDVKTLAGTSNWPVEHFKPRTHHYIAFVVFQRSIRDLESPPQVHLVPSKALNTFLSRRKLDAVAVDSLVKSLKLTNIWDQLLNEPAA
ncbi:MAG TPA: hypothetical protein VLC46_19895 [Thermoanaerobaculia bacterium]|jgi:hypothetical protein|nr:hypothetical protein [Thermoanaerobaculia bacterium]